MPPPRAGRRSFLTGPAVVALGGGHGLSATVRAMRRISDDVTAVVGVSDNGGSSGRLRIELGVPPPGDLRMALAAMCGDDARGRLWARTLQHRFDSNGDLSGHAQGNLLIAAMWQETGDVVVGLEALADAIGAHGRVLPVATDGLEIVAAVAGAGGGDPDVISEVRGQVEVARSGGRVHELWLEPTDVLACPAAVDAIDRADVLVLGPGSWFTSVLAPLRVPGVVESIVRSRARVVLVLNLLEQRGETTDLTPAAHLRVLHHHVPELRVDVVLVDASHTGDMAGMADLATAAALWDAKVVVAAMASATSASSHDPDLLAAAFARIV